MIHVLASLLTSRMPRFSLVACVRLSMNRAAHSVATTTSGM